MQQPKGQLGRQRGEDCGALQEGQTLCLHQVGRLPTQKLQQLRRMPKVSEKLPDHMRQAKAWKYTLRGSFLG